MEMSNLGFVDKNRLITIIGTGNYGTALGKRLTKFGYNIIYGSRKPDNEYIKQNFQRENSIQIYSIKEAWILSSNIVFFAIHASNYDEIIRLIFGNNIDPTNKGYYQQFKIVVDVSNFDPNNKFDSSFASNAEYLQSCFNSFTNTVRVVKAFNNISAYSMSCDYTNKGYNNNFYGNGEIVPIASDDMKISDDIVNLANQIGFRGCAIGCLVKSRSLEKLNETVFKEWHYASIFSVLFLLFNLLWFNLNSYVTKFNDLNEFLNKFSLLVLLNSALGFTALNLLTYVYLAGLIASIYQLYNGTKRKLFPKFLDLWLKSRKQLGLWAFFYATMHLILSLAMMSQGYLPNWHMTITQPKLNISKIAYSTNQSVITDISLKDFKLHGLTLNGELNVIFGVIAFLFMAVLAVTSINSIALSLNWSEWNFIQTNCGYICLAFGLTHDICMYSRTFLQNGFKSETAFFTFTRVKFYAIWLPLFVLLLKLVFTCVTPLRKRIDSIRRGFDYNTERDVELSTAQI